MGDEHINNVVTDSIKKFLELEQWKVEVDQKLKSLGTEIQNVRQVNTELKSENQKQAGIPQCKMLKIIQD